MIRRSRDSPRAFGELFHRHGQTVHRYVTRRAGVEVADEVVAETFLVAFERRDRFDHDFEDASPWLLGIATNLLKSYRRSEARHLDAAARAAQQEGYDGDLGRSTARLDAISDLASIAARVRALPVGDRDVLLLHAWGDLTGEQIAAALGVPVGTVWSRLSRARRVLRAAVVEEAGGEHGRAGAAETA